MKPFNLKEALAGKPVVTRDGREAKNIAHFPEVTEEFYKIVAIVAGSPVFYHEDGYDLFMKSEQKSGWLNLYPDGHPCFHMTRAIADAQSGSNCTGCVEIFWEE